MSNSHGTLFQLELSKIKHSICSKFRPDLWIFECEEGLQIVDQIVVLLAERLDDGHSLQHVSLGTRLPEMPATLISIQIDDEYGLR